MTPRKRPIPYAAGGLLDEIAMDASAIQHEALSLLRRQPTAEERATRLGEIIHQAHEIGEALTSLRGLVSEHVNET